MGHYNWCPIHSHLQFIFNLSEKCPFRSDWIRYEMCNYQKYEFRSIQNSMNSHFISNHGKICNSQLFMLKSMCIQFSLEIINSTNSQHVFKYHSGIFTNTFWGPVHRKQLCYLNLENMDFILIWLLSIGRSQETSHATVGK